MTARTRSPTSRSRRNRPPARALNPPKRLAAYAVEPMTLYHLEGAPRLESPIVVAAFDGWVDGGRAGTLAADQLAADGRSIASFDTDRIYDYRARRPTLQIINGKLMSLEWPELRLVATRIGERDVLVLTGAEPDYLWRQLQADVVGLARELGVVTWVSLGAIPATVPHTRPVPIL